MISIRVLNHKTGKPVVGARVKISFNTFPFSSFSDAEYTDEYGEVHFDDDPTSGAVYVNGDKVKEGLLKGLVIVYI